MSYVALAVAVSPKIFFVDPTIAYGTGYRNCLIWRYTVCPYLNLLVTTLNPYSLMKIWNRAATTMTVVCPVSSAFQVFLMTSGDGVPPKLQHKESVGAAPGASSLRHSDEIIRGWSPNWMTYTGGDPRNEGNFITGVVPMTPGVIPKTITGVPPGAVSPRLNDTRLNKTVFWSSHSFTPTSTFKIWFVAQQINNILHCHCWLCHWPQHAQFGCLD